VRNLLLIVCLVLTTAALQGQTVSIIGLDQLEARLANGADTSFIVNFWATWCGPCVKELPYFEQVENGSAGTNRKVLLVSLDFAEQLDSKVIPFIIDRGLKSEVVLMDEAKPNKWIPRVSTDWSGAIPATLFVNTEKKTRHFYEGSFKEGELETKLQELGF
jgi:thiol-disulfide isomerase/thioredoxin